MFSSVLLLALPIIAQAQSPSNDTLTRPSTLRYPWKYQGCYTDNRENRTVSSSRSSTSNSSTTVESCVALCANSADLPPALSGHTFNYAALSYGTECFCGLTLNPEATQVPEEQCNYPCSGNSTEPCGGSDRVSVYWNGEQQPVMSTGSRRWSPAGCYNDSATARILSVTQSAGSDAMTVYICTSACYNQKYTFAGLEYGRECYCGNSIGNGAPQTAASQCSMLCAGNATEYCGGDGSISVYSFHEVSAANTVAVPFSNLAIASALMFGWASIWTWLM